MTAAMPSFEVLREWVNFDQSRPAAVVSASAAILICCYFIYTLYIWPNYCSPLRHLKGPPPARLLYGSLADVWEGTAIGKSTSISV